MTDALTRVGEIRTQIATLQDMAAGRTTTATPTSTASSATSTANAAQFAEALSAATGLTGLTGTAGSATGLTATGGGVDALASSLLGGSANAATTGAATAPASTDAGAAKGQAVVDSAKEYLGVPYVWGGESLAEGGLDCSGLVQLVHKQHGVDLPRVARDQMREGTEIPSLAQARPGDLIVQMGGKHIGIYVGDGQMIHAPRPGKTVEISGVTDDEVTTIRRIFP